MYLIRAYIQVGGVCLRLNHRSRVGEVDGDFGRATLDDDVATLEHGDLAAVRVKGVVARVGDEHTIIAHVDGTALHDGLLERRGALNETGTRAAAHEHHVTLHAAPAVDEQFVDAVEVLVGRVGKRARALLWPVGDAETQRTRSAHLATRRRPRWIIVVQR